jgi:exonuclease SbcD
MLQTKSGPIQIVGIPWPTRNSIALSSKHAFKSASEITDYIAKAVGSIIAEAARNLDPALPAVLASHLTVSTGIFSGSEKRAIYGTDPVLLPSQLALEPFDYVALGHLHRYQDLNPNGYPSVVYAGSIERVDFGERKEDKGFCLVAIEKKGATMHEFITGPMRPFIQLEVHLKPGIDQTEQIVEALGKYTLDNAVIKILYHLPPGKKDTVEIPTIQAACAQAIHLVGIIPVRQPMIRDKRTALNVDMDLATLLGLYLDTKVTSPQKKEDLIQKALQLMQEHQDTQMENG